jgi:thiol:disulfide interchange protein
MKRQAAGGLGALAVSLLWLASFACVPSSPPSDPPAVELPAAPEPQPAAPAPAERPAEGPESRSAGAIDWEPDVERAFARARQQDRLLLVFVHADWSVESLRIAREVLRDPRVARASGLLVPLRLDVTKADAAAEARLARIDVAHPPALVVIDARGQRVDELEGPITVEAVLQLLARTAKR